MKNSAILLSSEPRGRFVWGTIYGTPVPGTVMELKPATAMSNGRHTWRAWSRATGALGPIAVLLDDYLQGRTPTTPYVSGTRGQLYFPAHGEELNMLLGDVGGTSDTVAIGDLFGVETLTGKIIANSSYTYTPFQSLEASEALSADKLIFCMFVG